MCGFDYLGMPAGAGLGHQCRGDVEQGPALSAHDGWQVDHFSADSGADAAWALPAMVGQATPVDRAASVDRMDAWGLFMLRS